MTEAEWLTSTDFGSLLQFADGFASRRKGHLFALAWLERHRGLLSSRSAWAFNVARRRAEGEDDPEVRDRAVAVAWEEYNRAIGRWGEEWATATHLLWRLLLAPDDWRGYRGPSGATVVGACACRHQAYRDDDEATAEAEARAALPLARDIFGNPFRPVAFDPRWRTTDVLGIAQGVYEDRAFDRLPLLADALMDAGCDDEQVLSHCRSEGPHVRGCFVVDMVLGKD